MFCHYFPSFIAYFKIDILHGNFPHTRHGKAAGCVSNLPFHRSQRPTLSIITNSREICNIFLNIFVIRALLQLYKFIWVIARGRRDYKIFL
ncbi:hypothetical protein FZC79_20225 [Rossellomorea vietnamensis]|uniref:Uncharacterized protein n=2 Tax=Rossellomorea TaxID=2837508 RepID=A0A5D4K744_9BACI|nr:hypothetical protein FZC79_20225 [Rossellomorea vietnamensis]TYS73254.1 hypothetical protein FZC80_19915 [Rossellomorea aquimaris]